MPGWLLGFSLTASTISAMSFQAIPAFSFREDYRWMMQSVGFLVMAVVAIFIVVPFFRKVTTPSGYAYLEQRFGTWARMFAAGGFLILNLVRLGVILYVTCLSLEIFLGFSALALMLVVGVVTTIYTMAGGFEAVVWTELLQTAVLIGGALVLVPVALTAIPGGLTTVMETAIPAGKMSLGSTEWTLAEKTVWVMLLASLFSMASDFTTRQDYIQRYRAASSLWQARLAIIIGVVTVVPVWLYFNFLGTVLWVLYKKVPDAAVAGFSESNPEKIVPHFILTGLPAGLTGLVMAGILMASVSTLAPILNACAVTWVSDFYQRFFVLNRSERHYLLAGRVSTAIFGSITVGLALWVGVSRTATLQDFLATIAMVLTAGVFGLFMLGFFSSRVGGRAALIAAIVTVSLVAGWVMVRNPIVAELYPAVYAKVPDLFWVPVLSNLLLPVIAVMMSRLWPEPIKDLHNLTYSELSMSDTEVSLAVKETK